MIRTAPSRGPAHLGDAADVLALVDHDAARAQRLI